MKMLKRGCATTGGRPNLVDHWALSWRRERVWDGDGHKYHRCELQLDSFVDRFDTLHQRVQEVYGPDLIAAWVAPFVGANIAEVIALYLNGDWTSN